MIRFLLTFALASCAGVSNADSTKQVVELDRIDSTIHEAPAYPERGNPLKITKKDELKSWNKAVLYEEKIAKNGVIHFRLKWPDATVTGAFPTRHCCTEVLFDSFSTSSSKWTFFRKVRIGDTESKVLAALAPIAKREKNKIYYCGLNECAIFVLQKGKVSKAELSFYLD